MTKSYIYKTVIYTNEKDTAIVKYFTREDDAIKYVKQCMGICYISEKIRGKVTFTTGINNRETDNLKITSGYYEQLLFDKRTVIKLLNEL